jgi:outer membrane protein assembly factor BamB
MRRPAFLPVRLSGRLAGGIAVLAALGGLLYAVTTRGTLDREWTPRRQSQQELNQQAAQIAAHREAQRTRLPLPVEGDAPSVPAPSETESAAARPTAAPYWTDFRGPQRDGHYRQRPMPTTWPSSGLRPLWKQPAGGGHASFVIAGGRAFTIEQRGGEEVVAAYDLPTGRELWIHAWPAAFSETYGGIGPRATPTWHDGIVYALGATGEFRALEGGTGRLRWRTNILEDAGAPNLEWGMAGSPLVVGGAVIVVPGGGEGRSVAAYDRRTGRRAWSALDDGAAYSSPMTVTLAGIEQLLVLTATRMVGLTTDGSRVLWEFPWPTQSGINVAQPLVIGENRVFVSSGYGMGAAMIGLSRDGDRLAVRELWRTNRMKNQFTSSVHHGGFIYGLDESILACLDAASGEVKWKGGRYGYGQVMLASDHLVVVTEDGELALVRATPERHIELSRFPVLEGRTWNHPAMADGYLLVRNTTAMAAFDLRSNR